MKMGTVIFCFFIVVSIAVGARAEFVQNPHDQLAADTFDLVFSVTPDAAANELQVQMDFYVFNDGNNVIAANVGFVWDNQNLQMDSAMVSPEVTAALDFFTFLYHGNDINLTNAEQCFIFAGVRQIPPGVSPSLDRRRWASYYFTLTDWSVNDSIVVDTLDFGANARYVLFTDSLFSYRPMWTGRKVICDPNVPCCFELTGNVDCSESETADIGDLTRLNDYLFVSFDPLCCPEEADMAQNGLIDVTDLTMLIEHLFITYEPLPPCP